jgi:hypothetical protein
MRTDELINAVHLARQHGITDKAMDTLCSTGLIRVAEVKYGSSKVGGGRKVTPDEARLFAIAVAIHREQHTPLSGVLRVLRSERVIVKTETA